MYIQGVNPLIGQMQTYGQYSSLGTTYPFVLSAFFAGEALKMNSIVKPATAIQLSAESSDSC